MQSPVEVLLDFIKCSYSSVKVSSRSKFTEVTCTETHPAALTRGSPVTGHPSTLLRVSLLCLQQTSILAATGWRSFAARKYSTPLFMFRELRLASASPTQFIHLTNFIISESFTSSSLLSTPGCFSFPLPPSEVAFPPPEASPRLLGRTPCA